MRKNSIIIVCILLVMGCDKVAQTEDSIKKYDEMAVFFDSGCVFVSGKLDIDISVLSCTFKMAKSKEFLLNELTKNGWRITQHKDYEFELERKSDRKSISRKPNDILIVRFKTDETVNVIWK